MQLWELQSLLAEMQARLDDPIPHRRPYFLELKDPCPRSGRTKKTGDYYKVSADLTMEGHDVLMQLPEGQVLKGIFWIEDAPVMENGANKQRRAKTRPEPTPYGKLWTFLLHRDRGFESLPGVREALEDVRESESEKPHELMRKVFGVEHLSLSVGPDEVYAKWPKEQYAQVDVLVQRAMREMG